jgi:hypothetical protein
MKVFYDKYTESVTRNNLDKRRYAPEEDHGQNSSAESCNLSNFGLGMYDILFPLSKFHEIEIWSQYGDPPRMYCEWDLKWSCV